LSLFAPLEDLIAPPPPESRVAFLKAQPFAHRGLHGRGVVENSQAAFRAAVAIRHGIELDVQAARDGEAMVFHDATLNRLTDATGDVSARTPAELARVKLKGTTESLVQLADVLKIVGGRVPVLVEVKTGDTRNTPLCLSVRRALEGYRGDVGVMSFNPLVVAWFRENAPRVVRGLVVTEEGKRNLKGGFERWASMAKAKPDFLAYDVRDLPSKFATAARARGLAVLTWTVRNAEAERRAFAHADETIYEKPA
jgi:glycerophosphoryl diester phosphodiesterase